MIDAIVAWVGANPYLSSPIVDPTNYTEKAAALGFPWRAWGVPWPSFYTEENWLPMLVKCPHCDAETGASCRTPTGYGTRAHGVRVKLAKSIEWE